MLCSFRRKFNKFKRDPEKFWTDRNTVLGRKISSFYSKKQKTKNSYQLLTGPTLGEILMKNSNDDEKPVVKVFVDKRLEGISPVFFKCLISVLKYAKCTPCYGEYRTDLRELVFYNGTGSYALSLNQEALSVGGGLWTPQKGVPLINITSHDTDWLVQTCHYINVQYHKNIDDFKSLYYIYKDSKVGNKVSVVMYALRGGIYSEKVINDGLEILITNENLKQSELSLIFSKLYRVLGSDWRLGKAVDKIRKTYKKLPDSFKIKLASFYNEAGENEIALNLMKEVMISNPKAISENRYLGLSYLMWQEGVCKEDWVDVDRNYFEKIVNSTSEFSSYLCKNDFAIVGNSPCEIGRSTGKEIDSGRKVCRFNSADVSYPHSEDYGSHINVLIVNPRYFETKRVFNTGLDFIVVADGSIFSTKNISLRLHELFLQCDHIVFFPKDIDCELTQVIEASPSSGLKFLKWVYSIKGEMSKSDIYGFSLIDQSYGMATSYSRGVRSDLPTIHDWEAEKKFFDEVVR